MTKTDWGCLPALLLNALLWVAIFIVLRILWRALGGLASGEGESHSDDMVEVT